MRDKYPQIFQLSIEEKLQLVQELWDDIAEHHADEMPLPEWQLRELERRHASYLQNPLDVLSWEEVVEDILNRHVHETGIPAERPAGSQ